MSAPTRTSKSTSACSAGCAERGPKNEKTLPPPEGSSSRSICRAYSVLVLVGEGLLNGLLQLRPAQVRRDHLPRVTVHQERLRDAVNPVHHGEASLPEAPVVDLRPR